MPITVRHEASIQNIGAAAFTAGQAAARAAERERASTRTDRLAGSMSNIAGMLMRDRQFNQSLEQRERINTANLEAAQTRLDTSLRERAGLQEDAQLHQRQTQYDQINHGNTVATVKAAANQLKLESSASELGRIRSQIREALYADIRRYSIENGGFLDSDQLSAAMAQADIQAETLVAQRTETLRLSDPTEIMKRNGFSHPPGVYDGISYSVNPDGTVDLKEVFPLSMRLKVDNDRNKQIYASSLFKSAVSSLGQFGKPSMADFMKAREFAENAANEQFPDHANSEPMYDAIMRSSGISEAMSEPTGGIMFDGQGFSGAATSTVDGASAPPQATSLESADREESSPQVAENEHIQYGESLLRGNLRPNDRQDIQDVLFYLRSDIRISDAPPEDQARLTRAAQIIKNRESPETADAEIPALVEPGAATLKPLVDAIQAFEGEAQLNNKEAKELGTELQKEFSKVLKRFSGRQAGIGGGF